MPARVDVAVVGGGLTGLCVADRLRRDRPDLTVRVYEASDRAGGKLLTERVETDDGVFLVEAGPDAWLAQKPWAGELVDELGLADEVIPIARLDRPVAILKGGRPVDLPEGVSLIAPTRLWPFLRSPLLSVRGKVQVAGDLVIQPKLDDGDESLGAFVERRLGREALDTIAEPIAAGIYNADPDRLSLLATFPQLRKLEREHGSVIRGLRGVGAKKLPAPARSRKRERVIPFLTLRDGMGTLADMLVHRVGDMVETGASVTGIAAEPGGGYRLTFPDRPDVLAERVVLAVPAAVAAELLGSLSPDAAARLRELRAGHAGTITLGYRTAEIPRPLPGYGLVIPKREGRPINAVTFASRKFPGRAPAGWELLRVFFGGYRSPATMELDDDALLALVRGELRDLLGITAPPLFHRIRRWPAGSPQYDVGHLERIAAIEAALPEGVAITGSPYRGVGIPDVIREARTGSWSMDVGRWNGKNGMPIPEKSHPLTNVHRLSAIN